VLFAVYVTEQLDCDALMGESVQKSGLNPLGLRPPSCPKRTIPVGATGLRASVSVTVTVQVVVAFTLIALGEHLTDVFVWCPVMLIVVEPLLVRWIASPKSPSGMKKPPVLGTLLTP